jgi:hypothetical protein
MTTLIEIADLADKINPVLCNMPDETDEVQRRTLHECKDLIVRALELLEGIAYGKELADKPTEDSTEQKHRVPREIVVYPHQAPVYPHFTIGTWTGLVKDAMGQVIEEENIESLSNIDATRDDVEQATVALAGRHGITIDSGYLHWDSNEHTAIWLAGDDESPHGWVCCQRGEADSIEDAKLGPIRLERSDAELDKEVFGFTEIKFVYDGWLYETDVLEDESDGD